MRETPRIDRRAVIKGAAWSVPVVAISIASPVAAASTVGGIALTWIPGTPRGVAFTNSTGSTIPAGTVTVSSVSGSGIQYLVYDNLMWQFVPGGFGNLIDIEDGTTLVVFPQVGLNPVANVTVAAAYGEYFASAPLILNG